MQATSTPQPLLARAGSWLDAARVRTHGTLLALCLWSVYGLGISTPGLVDRSGLLKGADFLQFQVFGSLAGTPQALYDSDAFASRILDLVPEAQGTTYLPIYGPQLALLFAPLGSLPYGHALALWTLLSASLYAASCLAIWRRCPGLSADGGTVALLAFASPAFFAVIGFGQISVLALACVSAAYLALARGRPELAGLAIGALAFKPQLGLAAAIVFVAAREWRIVGGAIVGALIQVLLAAIVLGPGVIAAHFEVLLSLPELAPVLGHKHHQMHSLKAFFGGFLPGALATGAWIATAGATLIATIRAWRSSAPLELRFSLLLLATALVNPHQYLYDLVILVPAWLLLADWMRRHPGRAVVPTLRLLVYLGFLLPALGPLTRWTHVQLSVLALAGLAWHLARLCRDEARCATMGASTDAQEANP